MKLKYSLFTVLFILSSCGEVENGVDGVNGLNILVNSEVEPSGTNCSNGGTKLSFGGDINGNGVLSVDEVTSTFYVCDGENGDNGLNGENGLDGLDGNSNVHIEVVQWSSNMTNFTSHDSPNNGDGYVSGTWTTSNLTEDLIINGVVLVQVGNSPVGPWFNLPYFFYDGDGSDVNYIYDSWYGYQEGQCTVSWDCSFGRTYSEWVEISSLYETYYKIITIEGSI